jgi:hypothetical protein
MLQGSSHPQVTFPVVSLATALTFGTFKLATIPVPLAASCLGGSLLIYDSVRAASQSGSLVVDKHPWQAVSDLVFSSY